MSDFILYLFVKIYLFLENTFGAGLLQQAKLPVQKEKTSVASNIFNYTLATVDDKPITLGKIFVSLVFLGAGIYISKIVIRVINNKILTRFVENESAAHAIENISFYFMVTFFALVSLQVANIPITVFTFVGGAFALAFGLGAQNISNNFVSGIILLIERPVKIGDFIEAVSYTHLTLPTIYSV